MGLKVLDRMRRQYCVYWPFVGNDSTGHPKFGTPVNLRVRWEDTNQVFINRSGNSQVSRARVFLDDSPTPAVDVKVLGVLLLGPGEGLATSDPLSTLTTPQQLDPFKNTNAWQIAKLDDKPSIKAKNFLRIAWL